MKVEVDFDLCDSQAVCVSLVPTVFEMAADGSLQLLQPAPPDSLREALESAEAACPMGAISVLD